MFNLDVLIERITKDLSVKPINDLAEHGWQNCRDIHGLCFLADWSEVGHYKFLPAEKWRVKAPTADETPIEDFLVGVSRRLCVLAPFSGLLAFGI